MHTKRTWQLFKKKKNEQQKNERFKKEQIFMPPTLKKLEGHIAFGLSVCVCVCVCVGASVNF